MIAIIDRCLIDSIENHTGEGDQDSIEKTLSNAIDFLAVESTTREDKPRSVDVSATTGALLHLVRSSEETTAKDTNQAIDIRTDPSITAVSVHAEHDSGIVLRPE